MSAELSAAHKNLDIELVPGDRGVFDVQVDDKLVFSRHASGGRFPDPGEISQTID